MRKHRKHRGHDTYHGDPQKASKKNYCLNVDCDFHAHKFNDNDNRCYRYRPCDKHDPPKDLTVLTQSPK